MPKVKPVNGWFNKTLVIQQFQGFLYHAQESALHRRENTKKNKHQETDFTEV